MLLEKAKAGKFLVSMIEGTAGLMEEEMASTLDWILLAKEDGSVAAS